MTYRATLTLSTQDVTVDGGLSVDDLPYGVVGALNESFDRQQLALSRVRPSMRPATITAEVTL